MTSVIRNDQSLSLEALKGPFAVDNRRLIAYYIDSNNLMNTKFNILNSAKVSEHLHTMHLYFILTYYDLYRNYIMSLHCQ